MPPVRTCVGCRERFDQRRLVRFAVVPDAPYLVPDARRKLGGRGVWVQPRRRCIEGAIRRGGFARAVRRSVTMDAVQVQNLLQQQLQRRLSGLMAGGRRARLLGLGAEAAREDLRAERTVLLWLAEDAAGRRRELLGLAERNTISTLTFGTKAALGGYVGRDALGVVSIRDAGLSEAVADVVDHLRQLTEDDGGLRSHAPAAPKGPKGDESTRSAPGEGLSNEAGDHHE